MNSAQIALLYRISELAKCYGLKPSEATANLHFFREHPDDAHGEMRLWFDGIPADPDKAERYSRMKSALGMGEAPHLATADIGEMEDVVEKALSRAPRARAR